MICLGAIGSNNDEDTDDCEEVEDNRPPVEKGEGAPALDVCEYRAEEGNNPCKLSREGSALIDAVRREHEPTADIEMVARANGSPITFPRLMRLRPYWTREFSIFLSEGE